MAQNITLPGYGSYTDVPSIIVPLTSVSVIPSTTINITQNVGNYGYYGSVSGSTNYNYQKLVITYDGTDYVLPLDPDPNNYGDGYVGYGAPILSDGLDFSTYSLRVEDDDHAGGWRVYNQTGGSHTVKVVSSGNALFTDVSDTTAAAADVTSGKYFYAADGTRTLGTMAGGSSYTQIYTGTVTANTTSTSATSLTTINLGASAYTANSILYVAIRDTAGDRAGYFIGSDSYCFNYNKANDSTTTTSYWVKNIHRKASDGAYSTYTAGTSIGYGIYPYSISSSGVLTLYVRYSSSYSLTINGTYRVRAFLLDYSALAGTPYGYNAEA